MNGNRRRRGVHRRKAESTPGIACEKRPMSARNGGVVFLHEEIDRPLFDQQFVVNILRSNNGSSKSHIEYNVDGSAFHGYLVLYTIYGFCASCSSASPV